LKATLRGLCGLCVLCLVDTVSVLAIGSRAGVAAADHHGQVTFAGLPVPGATVTAIQGDTQRATVTDQQGVYHLANLADGAWTIRIEMLGFAPFSQGITIPAEAPSTFTLRLLPFDQITAGLPPPAIETPPVTGVQVPARPSSGAASPPPPNSGFQRAAVNPSAGSAAASDPSASGGDAGDRSGDAADGFLINGSVNNSAASPFAQLPAFGNNRRGARSLYNGGIGVLLGNSAWDSRPFSFTGQQAPRLNYNDAQVLGSFAGPLKIPHVRNRPNLFFGYQHTADHNASTQSALMPTLPERSGDFSQSVDASGRSIQVVDPATGVPFAGNVIPSARISPQAASLLNFYPAPNLDAGGRYNYQTPVLLTTHQDALQSRVTHTLNSKNQLFGTLAYQRTTTDAANVFGFVDSSRVSGLDVPVNWSHRFTQFFSLRLRYQFTRLTKEVTPFFANRENISGTAGIVGNNQDPVNWGPPALIFSSGVAGLASAQYLSTQDRTHGWTAEGLLSRGRHNITFGGDFKLRHFDVLSQQDARGAFTFTGAATHLDLADFLLGLPHASAIAFGNPDKYFCALSPDAYVADDWRLSPTFTANIGLRWEYESPFAERYGRLTNLDVAPNFSAVRPMVGNDLLKADIRGLQPRVGVAVRPVPGSSLVIRAGYGIYRNTSVYQSIEMLLAQQPPLSKTLSVESTAANPLTLANGFVAVPGVASNTFAVDPDFRVGYAHNWQALLQRDLPASMTIIVTYLGTKGSHLMQEFLPNTYPLGAVNPCPGCPAGFIYLTSNGSSSRQAGQFQLRRRLRNGLTASVQYTLAKATDDTPAAFTGATLSGAAIAQDWLNLAAERGPSSFDQRHLVTAQFQYTTGVGMGGGALVDGVKGTLLKGWTVTSQLTVGSGLPLTPVYLTSVAGTGVTGTIRPDLTGVADVASDGVYANPAAFAPPAPGRWGSAGRNSIRGPAQFGLNTGVGRSFLWGNRLTLDWRLDATNVINHVTFAAVNTLVGSPQFGLASQANPMRKVQSSLRVRF
jgi:trimeric autotransporter adhesin